MANRNLRALELCLAKNAVHLNDRAFELELHSYGCLERP